MTTVNATPQTIVSSPAESEPAAFHRLGATTPNSRWWRPLLVGAVAIACYVVMFVVLLVLVVVAGLAYPGFDAAVDIAWSDVDVLDLRDPVTFAMGMSMLALLLPALVVAVRLVGARPAGLVSSVLGGLRWRWLARCVLVASISYTVAYGVVLLIAALQGESHSVTPDVSRIVLMLALTFLLVPLQSAAEEYVFRGYLTQAVGHYLRHPAFAILLPVPLFVFGHDYELLGQVDIAVFAIAAGWLTWRTGGLEAAIALHVVNNVTGLALGAFGLVDVNATDQSVIGLLLSVLLTLAFAAVVVRLAGRHSIQRTRDL